MSAPLSLNASGAGRSVLAILFAMLVATGLGCQQTEGQAVIRCEAESDAGWPGCGGLPANFDFEADFFALQKFEDLYDIRLQQGGKGTDVAEGFQIQVMSAVQARACLRTTVDVEAPDAEALTPGQFPACREDVGCTSPSSCPLVRIVAHFPRTCSARASALVAGDVADSDPERPSTISFSALGARPGDTVSGEFDLRIADGRTGETTGRCFTLDEGFSFVVKEGQPFVRFVE